jgi:GNAT superfamily N-acetyltransferase
MGNVTIRPAAAHEVPEIEAVGVAAYAEYWAQVPGPVFDAYLEDLHRLADRWREAEVLVAEADGRIAGSVLYYPDASTDGLGLPSSWSGFRKLAVHPKMRGRGLGRALTEACIAVARRRKTPAVGIHTTPFMQAACRLYERVGFERCPEFDMSAADMGFGGAADQVRVIAYRLDLAAARMTEAGRRAANRETPRRPPRRSRA